jgi:hypothetical protein
MFENKKNLGEDDMYSQVVYKNGKYVSDEQPPVFVYRTLKDESGGAYNTPYPRKGILTMLSESIFSQRNNAVNTREYQYLLRLNGDANTPMNATDYTGSLGRIATLYNTYSEKWGEKEAFEFVAQRLNDEPEENYYRFRQFPVEMPPEREVILSKDAEDERDSLHKTRTEYLESLLNEGTEESLRKFAYMEYFEPKKDKYGRKKHYIDEGRDLHYAVDAVNKIRAEYESQKAKEERAMAGHYTPFNFEPDPILATRMKRAEKQLKEAQSAFDKVMPKLIARDSGALYKGRKRGIAPENAEYFASKKQLTQKELTDLHNQKLEYNQKMDKAGQLATQLFDYSSGYKDTKVKDAKKGVNAAKELLESDYDAKAKTKSRGFFCPQYIEPTIAPLPANMETYKERAIAEFNDQTKTQNYQPDLIDNIAKKLKFW